MSQCKDRPRTRSPQSGMGLLKGCMLSLFSHVRFFATLGTTAHQAPLSMVSRQEYWRGLPCPPPGDLPDPGIEPASPVSRALAGSFFTMHDFYSPPSDEV